MTRFVRTKYQQYKRDTQQLSTWLAQAALQHGYPLSSFVRSKEPLIPEAERLTPTQINNARKRKEKKKKKASSAVREEALGDSPQPQQKASTGAAKESLKGEYVLKSHQYVDIAEFLVDKDVDIPTEVMQLIRRCIALRHSCLKRFLLVPDGLTKTHEFFIKILRQVYTILQAHRDTPWLDLPDGVDPNDEAAVAAWHASVQANVKPPRNYFATLAELDEAAAEHSEELPDIQLPVVPRAADSHTSAEKVLCDLEEDMQSAAMELLVFISDMTDVRNYIKTLWTDYRDHKIDLLTASVTSNTALELLRRPHDEVMARVGPLLSVPGVPSMAGILLMMVNYLSQFQKGPHNRTMLWLPLYTDLGGSTPFLTDLYDFLMVPNYTLLDGLSRVIQKTGAPVYRPGHYGQFDPTIDFEKASKQTRWGQGKILILESFADYLTLVRGVPMFLAHQNRGPLTEEEHWRRNPYKIDETFIEMSRFVETRKPTFLLMLHSQVFVDLNFTLRSTARRGLDELRAGTTRMLASLEERRTIESANTSQIWPAQNERAFAQFKTEAEMWVVDEDPVTSVRKFAASNAPGAGRTSEFVSYLMARQPILSGLLLFRLQLMWQKLGLALAGAFGSVLYAAHMYVAAKHSGTRPGEAAPHWPDMERVLAIHRSDEVFGGKTPTNVDDSLQSWLRMMGASVEGMQAFRRAGTGVPPSAAESARYRIRPPTLITKNYRPKGLEDYTQIQPIFKQRYLGNDQGSCIDINVIESLLSDMRKRQEHEEEKQRIRDEAAKAGTNIRTTRRKLLRKERSHRAPKFTILQLLAVLEAGLRSETDSIRLNYVSLHLRSIRALRVCRDAAHDVLVREMGPDYIEDERQLPDVVGHVLRIATMSGRQAELAGVRREALAERGIQVRSQLLVTVTDALKQFLSDPTEAAAELMSLQLGDASGVMELE